jgi:hypothetical protein
MSFYEAFIILDIIVTWPIILLIAWKVILKKTITKKALLIFGLVVAVYWSYLMYLFFKGLVGFGMNF